MCVVVGVGPGNGAAFARRFDAEGYRLALLSRSTDTTAALAEELGDARAVVCDVADPAAVASAFAEVRAELGPVDVLIYNAAGGSWGTLDKVTTADFERAFRISALGAFAAAQEVLPGMTGRGDGAIVFVGSTAALRGKPFTVATAPARAAQRSLAQALARQGGPLGVHVSFMVLDGSVRNPGPDDNRSTPTVLHPEDVASAALFLVRQPRSTWTFELDLRPYVEPW